ncbi:MAG: glycosyltransferase, partial [Xanthomonadales bacterium]|nr:glycosyltransferase [Xanthomonadales bacterium]
MSPLVSVVMPVHDGGAYLGSAVRSILSQTHHELELILVDDHSTDGAIAAIDRSDPRLKILASERHGVVNAFNTGFRQCSGGYIARMDADDLSLEHRLQCQLDYLGQNPGIDIAGCCVEIFSPGGIKGGMQRYQDWLNSVRDPDQVRKQIFIESPLPNPGLLFRQTALHRLSGYRDVGWPEDYDLL